MRTHDAAIWIEKNRGVSMPHHLSVRCLNCQAVQSFSLSERAEIEQVVLRGHDCAKAISRNPGPELADVAP